MASELKITTGIKYANGTATDTVASKQYLINQALKEFFADIVSVTTSEADLTLTGITNQGFMWLLNLDATNYVKFGPKNAGVMVEYGRLLPGEPAIIPLAPGIVHRWIANVATVKVLVKAYGR